MKTNRRSLIITSLCILLPVITGAALWGRLPDQIATHFNWHGEPDGWSSKIFAVFGLPAFLLAVHFICAFATWHDPKRENINGKILYIILWICPAVSIFTAAMIYPYALGYAVNINFWGMILTGSVLLITGNYLPKCRRNYTVGIKLPWTLADEDNWNRTHRFAGPLWVAVGAFMILSAFIFTNQTWIVFAALIMAVIAPIIYSAALYIAKRGK